VNLRILAEAEAELRSAFAYLSDQSPALGGRFLDEVADAFDAIRERPWSFAKLETLPENEPYRRALLPTFRYAVVFEVFDVEIVVVAVLHTSREPNYWIQRLK
jgi:plasmid stabilization system protein ParE